MQGDDTIDERLELIIKQKAVVEKQIAELTETLHTLEFKEWYYTTAKNEGTTAVPRNMTLSELPKEYRKIFSESDIIPIGNRPCGRSFTGFYIKHTDGEYALVFREATNEKCGTFSFSGNAEKATVLLSNGNVSTTVRDGILDVEFDSPCTFAFVKFN